MAPYLDLPPSLWVVLATALLTPVVYFVYHAVAFIVDVRRRGKAVDKFPGDPTHWLWGNVHTFPRQTDEALAYQRGRTERFPRAFRIWVGFLIPKLSTCHPDTVRQILRTSEPKPRNFSLYQFGRPWIGDGLITSSGARWARNRRLITPAFHFDVLKQYITRKNQAVQILIDKMQPYATSGKSFEFFGNVSLLTFDIILRCAFSLEDDIQLRGENHPYVQAVGTLQDLWLKRTLQPLMYSDFIYNLFSKDSKVFKRNCDYVHSISSNVIEKRKQFLKEQNEANLKSDRCLDFLDILLMARDEDGVGLTDQEIREEVDTFMFAGHDTTASGISWVLYSLAQHPQYQILCQQEIDSILDGRSDDTITWNDLSELKYLTLCIKESLRMNGPVSFVERQTANEITIDGKTIPPGSYVNVQIYNLHHNPIVWDNPMEYRPSRFLPENIGDKDAFAFVPFSAGPRNCIGQHFALNEEKVVLARILRRYTIALDPDFKVKKKLSVVLKTENGMYMKIIPRNLTGSRNTSECERD